MKTTFHLSDVSLLYCIVSEVSGVLYIHLGVLLRWKHYSRSMVYLFQASKLPVVQLERVGERPRRRGLPLLGSGALTSPGVS